MVQQLILHFVEFLDDLSLIEMLLHLLVCCYVVFEQWIYQVLKHLPEPKEIIALSNHEIHVKVLLSLHVVKALKSFLELECHVLVDLEHFQH